MTVILVSMISSVGPSAIDDTHGLTGDPCPPSGGKGPETSESGSTPPHAPARWRAETAAAGAPMPETPAEGGAPRWWRAV